MFVQAPKSNFYYPNSDFIRISFIIPNGVRTPSVSVLLNKKLVDSVSFPRHTVTLYKGPSGILYNALDISQPGDISEGDYSVIASNLGGTVAANFSLIIAGNNYCRQYIRY